MEAVNVTQLSAPSSRVRGTRDPLENLVFDTETGRQMNW